MIDFKKASEAAIFSLNLPSKIHSAWDYGSFFLFSLAPTDVKENERYDTGTMFTAVDKSSGRVYDYDITSDLDAFENAKILV